MLNDDFLLVQHADSTADISVDLDPLHYSKFDDFKTRFPHGAPSLRRCTSFSVRGDVKFSKGVQIEGAATVINGGSAQAVIAEGATVTGNVVFG